MGEDIEEEFATDEVGKEVKITVSLLRQCTESGIGSEARTFVSLLFVHFLEPASTHPGLSECYRLGMQFSLMLFIAHHCSLTEAL